MSLGSAFRIAVRKFGPFESAIRRQWESFQRAGETDLALETEALDLHSLYETLFTREGLRRGEWDVAFLNTDWIAAAREQGALADLAPFLRADPPEGFPDGWTPSLLRLQQFGDEVMGLPYHDGPECLIYRTDLFGDSAEQDAYRRAYGKPLAVPRTWDEFRAAATHFTRPAEGLYGTVFAAFPDGHNTVYDFCLQLWTRGGELFDSAGRVSIDTGEAAAALDFYRQMLNDPRAVHPNSREFDSVKSGLAFADGEIVMMVNWFGFAAMCEAGAGRIRGKVGIAPIPCGEGGRPVSLNVYWLLAIASGSRRRETAYRFLRHCAGAEMDKLLTLEGAIGCRKTTWSDADVNRAIPFYRELESIHAGARELPRLERWAELAAVIDRLVLDTINTSRPVRDLLAEAQRRAA